MKDKNTCEHRKSHHFHENAPPYCPECDSYPENIAENRPKAIKNFYIGKTITPEHASELILLEKQIKNLIIADEMFNKSQSVIREQIEKIKELEEPEKVLGKYCEAECQRVQFNKQIKVVEADRIKQYEIYEQQIKKLKESLLEEVNKVISSDKQIKELEDKLAWCKVDSNRLIIKYNARGEQIKKLEEKVIFKKSLPILIKMQKDIIDRDAEQTKKLEEDIKKIKVIMSSDVIKSDIMSNMYIHSFYDKELCKINWIKYGTTGKRK